MVKKHAASSSSGMIKDGLNFMGENKENYTRRQSKRERRISSRLQGYIILTHQQNIKGGSLGKGELLDSGNR